MTGPRCMAERVECTIERMTYRMDPVQRMGFAMQFGSCYVNLRLHKKLQFEDGSGLTFTSKGSVIAIKLT